MKKNLLLLFFLSLCCTIYSQENNISKINNNNLIGIWFQKRERGNPNLVFEKKFTSKLDFGLSLTLYSTGDFKSSYKAPCGSDRALFTKNYSDKWLFNKETNILKLTNSKDQTTITYEIIDLKNEQLILSKIKDTI